MTDNRYLVKVTLIEKKNESISTFTAPVPIEDGHDRKDGDK